MCFIHKRIFSTKISIIIFYRLFHCFNYLFCSKIARPFIICFKLIFSIFQSCPHYNSLFLFHRIFHTYTVTNFFDVRFFCNAICPNKFLTLCKNFFRWNFFTSKNSVKRIFKTKGNIFCRIEFFHHRKKEWIRRCYCFLRDFSSQYFCDILIIFNQTFCVC